MLRPYVFSTSCFVPTRPGYRECTVGHGSDRQDCGRPDRNSSAARSRQRDRRRTRIASPKQQNPVHMVRHHHECVYPHVWEMIRNAHPTLASDFAKSTQYHFGGPHTPKKVRGRTDGHEVRARTGIVMATQPERPPVHADSRMPRSFHPDMLWSWRGQRVTDLAGTPTIFAREMVRGAA